MITDAAIIVPLGWYATDAPAREYLIYDSRTELAPTGIIPRGEVMILSAEGGCGKTTLAIDLGLAVACGGQLYDALTVRSRGRVLIVIGEEDADEAHRRLYKAASDRGQPPPESVVVMPMKGIVCAMLDKDDNELPFLVELREYLRATGPYDLVVIDPISRFCGPKAETDNAAGTRFIQALESLIPSSGGATILGSSHTNKDARALDAKGAKVKVGTASNRGSTAITDGARCVVTLTEQPNGLTVRFTKANYSKKAEPIELHFDERGVLVAGADEARSSETDVPRGNTLTRRAAKAVRYIREHEPVEGGRELRQAVASNNSSIWTAIVTKLGRALVEESVPSGPRGGRNSTRYTIDEAALPDDVAACLDEGLE